MTPETDARRRSIRTAFQAFISAASVLLVAIPVAMATLEGAVSPAAYGTLAAVAASITAGATLVTRIMALPRSRRSSTHTRRGFPPMNTPPTRRSSSMTRGRPRCY